MKFLLSKKPLFIPFAQGDLFALYFAPCDKSTNKCVLHIPAFAEEMNKSRHMVAHQAQAFCEQGYSVLVLDLLGTGDSQGDFSEATWPVWLNNIEVAIDWLINMGNESISLWGLRSGALLAMDFLNLYPGKIDRLICWQPVLNGEIFIMQFLRLRIATAMMDKNALKEKTSDLKKMLLDGKSVEVAGYMLNPELIKPMMVLRAQQMNLQNVNECNVFELTAGSEQEASHATKQWLDQIKHQDLNVTLETVCGSSFWATQEIAEVSELIEITSRRIV